MKVVEFEFIFLEITVGRGFHGVTDCNQEVLQISWKPDFSFAPKFQTNLYTSVSNCVKLLFYRNIFYEINFKEKAKDQRCMALEFNPRQICFNLMLVAKLIFYVMRCLHVFEEEVCHTKLEAKPKFVSKVAQCCLPPCKPTLIISVKL